MNKKTAIIYKSSTGFTKKYAEMLSAETGATLTDFKSCSKKQAEKLLQENDIIIFGSRLHAGTIDGFKKARDMFYNKGKNFIIFATGAMPAAAESEDTLKQVWEKNLSPQELNNIPHFYFQGGLCYEKMSFLDRFLMKGLRTMLKNKKNKTDADIETEKMIAASFDISSKEYISPLLDYLRGKE